jgi:hypothetical protein
MIFNYHKYDIKLFDEKIKSDDDDDKNKDYKLFIHNKYKHLFDIKIENNKQYDRSDNILHIKKIYYSEISKILEKLREDMLYNITHGGSDFIRPIFIRPIAMETIKKIYNDITNNGTISMATDKIDDIHYKYKTYMDDGKIKKK